MSNRHDWKRIRKEVNLQALKGNKMSMKDIKEKYNILWSTLSKRVNADSKKGVVWDIKYYAKNLQPEKDISIGLNISSLEVIQRAIDKIYEMIQYAKDGNEMEKLSSAIVKLAECKKELEEGKNETNLDTVQLPDNVKSILNN